MKQSRRTLKHGMLVGLWLGVSGIHGCGRIGEPSSGSESHFLHHCQRQCGDGLQCISGICTEACLVGNDANCHSLHESSVCTNESVEPGSLAVCDVACDAVSDCASLGPHHACEGGFCRGPVVDASAVATGGAGPGGGSSVAGSGQGGSGQGGVAVTGGAGPGGGSSIAGSGQGGSGQGGVAVTGGAGPGGGSSIAGSGQGGSGQGGVAVTGGSAQGGSGTIASGGSTASGAPDGFLCNADPCEVGEICTACRVSTTTFDYRCTPHPDNDASGFASATADCIETVSSASCDGPEDCPGAEICQADTTLEYASVSCSEESDACAPYAYCRSCHTNADCDAGFQCLARDIEDPSRGTACGDTLPMLLARGDWLIGWSGGLDHINWFHFTPGAANLTEGTVQVRSANCPSCTDWICHDSTGRYTVLPDNQVTLEFEGCAPSTYVFRLLGESTFVHALPARLQGVVIDPESGSGAGATLYDRGVSCELDFSSCVYPPPVDP